MNATVPIIDHRPDPMIEAQRLEQLRNDPERLRKAAAGFEALLLAEILRPLESSTDMLGQSMGSRFARSMFHEAIVGKVADGGGLGIADMVLAQLGRSRAVGAYGPSPHELAWPIQGMGMDDVSSGFGHRADPFTGESRMHTGIDMTAPAGTPVFPLQEGRVVFAGTRGGYGELVIVEHDEALQSWYAHLSDIHVETGDWLDASSRLGAVGSTGRSTGPHLHLEVRRDDAPQDPRLFLEQR